MTYTALVNNLKSIPNNLFSGFVVSLVALPLGLGLAIASGAPPISGVITAIVGGIIVSILGGGHVTITGPGNGLVVAHLGAITVLGNGNMYEGYLYTIAAVIASGVLITALSFIKVGYIGNFFSSSALQGMLSAIGIIIFAKQVHLMLGNLDSSGDTIHLLLEIPNSISAIFSDNTLLAPAAAGLLSLLIMITYSLMRNKYFQLIPAPMWIVIISILFAYYIQSQPHLRHPLDAEYLLNIPSDALSKFPRPNFSKYADYYFILAVLSITLIATIESILSIKAVDKLDPKKRHSNIDKELRALGLATIASGFLGGLNVVTVIARSSVNVHNGGTNRSSNLFHSCFLLVFILVFQEQLKHIPFPALAAILVYTGYKLASPSVFLKIYQVGKEQFLIFLVTLLSTIFTNLISGILIGTLTTFFVHSVYAKSFTLFIRYLFSNNVIWQKLDGDRILVTVKYYCTFLNFYRLKHVIDNLPDASEVLIDFKQCKFVDHTTLESLNAYESNFNVNDKYYKMIGLDTKRSAAEHPFALKSALQYVPFVDLEARTHKRQRLLADFVKELGWNYKMDRDYDISFLGHFAYFTTRQASNIFNACTSEDQSIRLFDLDYSEGAFIAKEDLHSTFVYIKVPREVPAFTLEKRDFFEKLSFLTYSQEIRFRRFSDFTDRFTLKGKNKRDIRRYFNEALVLFFECNQPYHIESNGEGGIIVMNREHTATISEIKAMTDFCIRLQHLTSVTPVDHLKRT